MNRNIRKSRTLWIGKKAYFFLRREERKQRGCKPLTEKQEENVWRKIKASPNFRNGQYQIDNDSFGGGDGTYEGKWWAWSVDYIMKMLDDNGLSYRKGHVVEYIDL